MVKSTQAKEIRATVREYFKVTGKVIVNPDLTVDIQGDIDAFDEKSMWLGQTQLPVTFREVTGHCLLNYLPLTTLAGVPRKCTLLALFGTSKITNLEHFPEELDVVSLSYDPNLPLLRTLNAKKEIRVWQGFGYDPKRHPISDILNDPLWRGQGRRGAMRCIAALVEAGYDGNAKW